jgi:hypothetical protein
LLQHLLACRLCLICPNTPCAAGGIYGSPETDSVCPCCSLILSFPKPPYPRGHIATFFNPKPRTAVGHAFPNLQ